MSVIFHVALLFRAFKGMGTNEKLIIDALGSMTAEQRLEVAKGYKGRYRKVRIGLNQCVDREPTQLLTMAQDLIEMLKDELGGHFEDICVALVTEPLEFDVKTFHLLIEVRRGFKKT